MQMTPQKRVFINAHLLLGHMHKIQLEHVFLGAQSIHMAKIIPDSVFQVVLLGEHLLIIRQHFV